jgi:hypothetical protein
MRRSVDKVVRALSEANQEVSPDIAGNHAKLQNEARAFWTRAESKIERKSHWSGKRIETMARDPDASLGEYYDVVYSALSDLEHGNPRSVKAMAPLCGRHHGMVPLSTGTFAVLDMCTRIDNVLHLNERASLDALDLEWHRLMRLDGKEMVAHSRECDRARLRVNANVGQATTTWPAI